MKILQVLLDPILPVFAIMAFGFVMGRTGKTSVDDARLINRFAMTVLLPVFIFGLIASSPMHEFSLAPVAVYASVQAIIFTLGYLLASRVFKRPAAESILLSFCGIFANNALYILPMAQLIYGEDGILPISTIITLDATLTFGFSMVALQMISLGKVTLPAIASSMAKTPMLQAVIAGLIVAAIGFELPAPIQTFIKFTGAAAAPVALYALGVVVSQTRFRLDGAVATFTIIKLLFFPALIWAGMAVFTPHEVGRDLFLLASAGPAGAMAFSLALLYNIRTDAIAQIIIWTSVLTLFTLAVLA